VPGPVRDRVLGLSREVLGPNGVAYVSFNTYPMWHSAMVLRMLMLDAVRSIDSTRTRVVVAREFLGRLVEQLDTRAPYQALLRDQAATALAARDADLAHDYLEVVNDPMYLHEFVANAATHRLRYLDDLVVSSAPPFAVTRGHLPSNADDVRDQLRHDLLGGSSLRAAALCRDDPQLRGQPDAATLLALHVAAPVAPAGPVDPLDASMAQFAFPDGPIIGTSVPAVKVALSLLGDAWPASIPLRNLLAATQHDERLFGELHTLHRHHLAHFTSEPLALVTTVSERPSLARAARRGMELGDLPINRWYEEVELDPPFLEVARLLDGSSTPRDLEATFGAFVPEALDGLARMGLLVS
jgi:hypothetical protein